MKERVTRELFGYWDRLRGGRTAPDRADIDPGAIATCLANMFVLTFDPETGHPFRIAGTAVCSMFGRELTRVSFTRLWAEKDRDAVARLVCAVAEENEAVVGGGCGCNADGDTAAFEMILLPLTSADGAGRLLGAIAAPAAPYWLGTRPLQSLQAKGWCAAGGGKYRHTGGRSVMRTTAAAFGLTKSSGLTLR